MGSPRQEKSANPSDEKVLSPSMEEKKKSGLKMKLLRSKSKEALKDSSVSKKGDDDAVVRLERYDVLLDDELPELPSVPPPINNKSEYKQYMVLRYEYERRGLLQQSEDASSKIEGSLSPKSARFANSPNKADVGRKSDRKAEGALSPKSDRKIEASISPIHNIEGSLSPKSGRLDRSSKKADEKKSGVQSTMDDFDPSMPEAFDDDLAAHLTAVQAVIKPVPPPEAKKKKPVVAKPAVVEKPVLRYKEGDKVESLWEDGIWYASTVTQIDLESPGGPFYLVLFDDFGNDQVCQGNQLRWRSHDRIFAVGDMCECKWVEDEQYYLAQVMDAGTISDMV